jgi:hypothetical protein
MQPQSNDRDPHTTTAERENRTSWITHILLNQGRCKKVESASTRAGEDVLHGIILLDYEMKRIARPLSPVFSPKCTTTSAAREYICAISVI